MKVVFNLIKTTFKLNFNYFNSPVAPASVNFFKASSAEALSKVSLTTLGAASTISLASFKPRPVISRTALIVFTLLSPIAVR